MSVLALTAKRVNRSDKGAEIEVLREQACARSTGEKSVVEGCGVVQYDQPASVLRSCAPLAPGGRHRDRSRKVLLCVELR
jgi:hypothetical protein